MLKFVIRKMLSKKWMVLSLLIGNILLISIAAGNPMYTQAVFQRTLTKNLENYLTTQNAYPGLITFKIDSQTTSRARIDEYTQEAEQIPQSFGLNALHSIELKNTTESAAVLETPRSDAEDIRMAIASMSGLGEHVQLLAGRMYSAEPGADGVIDAMVSERTMHAKNLLLDDVLTMDRIFLPDGRQARIRIAGVFTNSSAEDIYWVRSPGNYQQLFIDPALFETLFVSGEELANNISVSWNILLDYTAMRGTEAEKMLAVGDAYRDKHNGMAIRGYGDNFSGVLSEYIKTVKKVDATLWVLQVPVFVLLAAFIFMVSRQMLDIEQSEIAVVKSRGAGKGQIFAIYLIQSLLIAMLSLAAGIPLGAYLVQVLGSSNAFLEFVRRSALPVEVNARALGFAGAAALLSVCAMVLPAVRYSRASIVNAKRQKNRRNNNPLWQKLGLDFILLGVALYGLYSFAGQREILAARVQEGASLDPLLFLSSSLFMIGSGLLAVRVVPLVVWCVYRIFRRFWSPALYASFLHVLRTRTSQSFMMVFLIMTIALGVFNAQAARTINQNAQDNLYYSIGADVVLQETWLSSGGTDAMSGEPTGEKATYREPDYGRFQSVEGAEAVTKVYINNRVSASVGSGTIKNVKLMGIHTREFGETAWFKDTLSDVHWYHYLNAMSQNSRAILVSRNFQTDHKCRLGDSISYRNIDGDPLRGVIYGFVDYFPGFEPVSYTKGTDGLYHEAPNYLIVANLQQVQAVWGVEPYEIWMKNRDSSQYVYDLIEEKNIMVGSLKDAGAKLVEKKNDPILQGTNGILTVGFIVVLLLCSVGFLIYWILSIQSRSLLFGIFRAMGMSMREVFSMLINEQLFISGLSIAVGAVVGKLTAYLYMPLIQLGYASSDNSLPLEVISLQSDQIRLFVVIGAVMLICLVILGALISHMKITQALKLGED